MKMKPEFKVLFAEARSLLRNSGRKVLDATTCHRSLDDQQLQQLDDHARVMFDPERRIDEVPAHVAKHWRTLCYLNLPTASYRALTPATQSELELFNANDQHGPPIDFDFSEGTPYLSVAGTNSPPSMDVDRLLSRSIAKHHSMQRRPLTRMKLRAALHV